MARGGRREVDWLALTRVMARGRAVGSERGQAGANVVVLVVVLAAVGVASILLFKTLGAAQRINDKADNISKTGQGINIATDAVVQLNRTNETAGSILTTAEPLEGQLDEIVGLAKSIDGLGKSILSTAGRINSTARTVNGTAGEIDSTAKGINSTAAQILDVARRIDNDVRIINETVDTTIGLARAIKSDTGNILGQARRAHNNACDIDQSVGGGDGHC